MYSCYCKDVQPAVGGDTRAGLHGFSVITNILGFCCVNAFEEV